MKWGMVWVWVWVCVYGYACECECECECGYVWWWAGVYKRVYILIVHEHENRFVLCANIGILLPE